MSNRGTVKVTGVSTSAGINGSFPVRLEIRDLEASNPDQFNLFVLGMRDFQAVPKTTTTSYYQLAGIHGLPAVAWDNAAGIRNFDFGGYCTHSSILFLPWHRPYLCLLEQSLYNIIQDVARKFPASVRNRYVEAAKTFRLPYYDWAARVRAGARSYPSSLANSTITVTDTDGQRKSIANPLYSFNVSAMRPAPNELGTWTNQPRTRRNPMAQGELDNESASRRTEISQLLLAYTDFDAFSNTRWAGPGNPGTFGSIEGVHDDIHGIFGGSGGHMGSLDVSAMDPIFWLHHCNVDRMWAMWQDLNPNEYLSPRPAPWSTFSTARGTTEDKNSLLSPFWDETGARFWTADRVKDTKKFYYAYPETQSWLHANANDYRIALRQSIARLYGSNVFRNFAEAIAPAAKSSAAPANSIASVAAAAAAPQMRVAQKASAPPTVLAAPVQAAGEKNGAQKPMASHKEPAKDQSKPSPERPVENPIEESDISGPIPDELSRLAPDNKYTEWIVNIRVKKHALGQPFRVIVFLGDFSGDPADWDGNTEFNIVGRVNVLGREQGTQCDRCQDDMADDLIVTGTVPLTSALLQDIEAQDKELQSLNPQDVVPYLTRQLHWRVKTFAGNEQSRADVPGLKVSVCSTIVTIDEYGVPVYSCDYTTHKSITQGRPGGLDEEDDD